MGMLFFPFLFSRVDFQKLVIKFSTSLHGNSGLYRCTIIIYNCELQNVVYTILYVYNIMYEVILI